jgi:rRNA-processing protein CGR1
MSEAPIIKAPPATESTDVKGMKKNGMRSTGRTRDTTALTTSAGKQWHDNKAPFRPHANLTSWEKRTAERKALAAIKAKEKELKEEKESERQVGERQDPIDKEVAADRVTATCRSD